jgi:FdhE protein
MSGPAEHAFGSAPSGIMQPPAVVLPDGKLFSRRALRLAELAERVPALGDFLEFMALLAQAQQRVLSERAPAWTAQPGAFDLALEHGMAPLGIHALRRDLDWTADLSMLLDALEVRVAARQRPLLDALRRLDAQQLEALADDVLEGRPGPDALRGLMPLLAAALQVAWVRLAGALPRPPQRPGREAQALCPCCGSAPVASVIHIERQRSGVRYLHCGLCATEWNLERVRCTVCGEGGHIHYLGMHDEQDKPILPVQAETCGDCHSYLKVVQREFHGRADPLADDLASLALDLMLAEQGEFSRSGHNPLMIAG